MNGEARSNYSGKLFEDMVNPALKRAGYKRVDQVTRTEPFPCFMKQARLGNQSIYGKSMRHDAYCWNPEKFKHGLIIEVKYQAVSGSVDEKFPYLVFSLKQLETPSILILEGGGALEGAVRWCVEQNDGKFQAFDGISAFIRAANSGLL